MDVEIPQWQLDAARELSRLDEVDSDGVEGWEFDSLSVTWPEGEETPGLMVSLGGQTLTLNAGFATFETDLVRGDLLDTARRLLAALAAFDVDP